MTLANISSLTPLAGSYAIPARIVAVLTSQFQAKHSCACLSVRSSAFPGPGMSVAGISGGNDRSAENQEVYEVGKVFKVWIRL